MTGFQMDVEDSFTLPGKGLLLFGTPSKGRVHIGDILEIVREADIIRATVTGIEQPGSVALSEAACDTENVGIIFRELQRGDAVRGHRLRSCDVGV